MSEIKLSNNIPTNPISKSDYTGNMKLPNQINTINYSIPKSKILNIDKIDISKNTNNNIIHKLDNNNIKFSSS